MIQEFTVGVCEDDDELRGVLRSALERDGYRVRATASGGEAVAAFAERPPDVLVLDIGLPDADGRDVCQALRARGVAVPVLFLTARDALTDRLSGFHSGGDDYVTKPFAVAELIVRIEALLRRSPPTPPAAQAGALRLDPAAHGIAGPDGHRAADADGVPPARRARRPQRRGRAPRRARACGPGRPGRSSATTRSTPTSPGFAQSFARPAVPETVENVRGVGYALR